MMRSHGLLLLLPLFCLWIPVQADEVQVEQVIKELNTRATVRGTDDSMSYKVLFDAYLELPDPPMAIDEAFNLETIYPGMNDWPAIAAWAETNQSMAEALYACRDRTMIGLPYGRDAVPEAYQAAGLMADIGVGGSLRKNEFPYLNAVDTISAFATAETYRRIDAGRVEDGIDLALAHLFVLRQFCDREFLVEKKHAIGLLTAALGNLRDLFYLYQDDISPGEFTDLAWYELPYLRPDRTRLLMPEADRVVSEALIKEVFYDSTGDPDAEKFAKSFAGIQSENLPLTRFGAAKRWKMIAEVHSSLDASLERLTLVYDDWWRRWRVQAHDDFILSVPTQFVRVNPVRYAAVIYSMQNIEGLFEVRNRLITEVNGTAMAAGLCAYKQTHGRYPVDQTMIAQFVRKRSDTDPYDPRLAPFKYRVVEPPKRREAPGEWVDVGEGRIKLLPGESMLYSKGQDLEDNRAVEHTDDGLTGDILLWPPVKAYSRAKGFD